MTDAKRININGFLVPSSYHNALDLLVDALRYGEISMIEQETRFHPKGGSLDRQTPVGYFLTADQCSDYIMSEAPVDYYGVINFEAMFSMHIGDITEIQSWFSVLKEKVTEDNANEVRLEMIEWLEQLKELRPDYPNPAL
jgi:hypothetical protein